MKTITVAAVLPLLAAGAIQAQELPKAQIAIVRIHRLTSNELLGYEMLRLLSADKESLEALRKINVEIKDTYKQILDAYDETALNELSRKLEFLNRKRNILLQRAQAGSGGDMQKLVRDFTIANFRDKYHIIVQEPEIFDRVMFKGNVEIRDITEEVADKIREHFGAVVSQ